MPNTLNQDRLLQPTRESALEVDQDQRVVEYDNELGCWGVFGSQSGYLYSEHETRDAAERAVPESRRIVKSVSRGAPNKYRFVGAELAHASDRPFEGGPKRKRRA